MKKMNNKGYMLVEIILAFVISFGILYFMMDIVIKLKNKNDDLLVETVVKTDSSIVTNKLMEYAIADVEDNDTADEFCSKIEIEGQTIKYGTEIIDIVDDTATIVSSGYSCNVDEEEGKVSVRIPLDVKQNKDRNFDIEMDYNYELEELIIRSYWCANGSYGSEPWDLHYTGNCLVEGFNDINWKVKFLTSGDLKVRSNATIDVFLVGGGGGGGSWMRQNQSNHKDYVGGGGGGGGRTKTITGINIIVNEPYYLYIGDGGYQHCSGESTTGFNESVQGGSPGDYRSGGSGGSGGGAGGCDDENAAGYGGTDGGSGVVHNPYEEACNCSAGIGLDATTREFWEDSGALYAGGGGGGAGLDDDKDQISSIGGGGDGGGGGGGCGEYYCSGGNGIDNTGGGGGGGGGLEGSGGKGGSGIIVIRNARNS